MKYHVWTIGCQMNVADSRRLASELEHMGYAWTDRLEDADVVVLNTCVVRQQAEDRIHGRMGALRALRENRPGTVVALMGCLVGHKPGRDLVQRFPEVDVFLPPSETRPLLELLRARADDDATQRCERASVLRRWALQDGERPELLLPERERGRLVSAHVPVAHGCSWVCTFCIVPSRRGPEHSRAEADILAEVENLVRQGVREVTLLGQIVDRYGHDRGEPDALPRLLERVSAIDELLRVRFLTNHPSFLSNELLDAVARLPKVMEHIEIPVQAGHNDVLSRMKRGYTVEEYRRVVERVRHRVPGAAVHTDVIVGFCGETEEAFQATHDLMAELRFDKAHIAKFSPRPGTVAALRFEDDVPPAEKERRRKALDELQERICAEINAAQKGRTLEVLVDGRDRARWRGRTRTNKLVFFEDARAVLGRLVDVTIDWAGPWSMVGHTNPAAAAGESAAYVTGSAD